MRGAIVSLLVVPLLVPSPSLSAQAQPPVEPGARVRISSTYPTQAKSVGTCVGFAEGYMQFTPSGMAIDLSIPVDSITALEVSRGHKSHTGQGAWIGLLAGTATGALLGAVVGLDPEPCGPGREAVCVAVGAAEGAILGVLVGLAAGALIKTDSWEQVPLERLRVGFAPQRERHLGVGLSLTF